MKFSSGPGRALVPLGAYPDWLLARQITSLSVEPAGGLSVSELTLLRYLPE